MTDPSGNGDDDAVAAAGKVTEALEWVERARGHLYELHQQIGHADLLLGQAIDALRAAGADDLADEVTAQVLGRDVLEGRWTFQVVEEFDDGYYAAFRQVERRVREQLVGGRRHVAEADIKASEQSRAEQARPSGIGRAAQRTSRSSSGRNV